MTRSNTTVPTANARPPTPQSIVEADLPDISNQSSIAPPTQDSKRSASQVRTSDYRNELQNHSVYIDLFNKRGMPEAVKTLAGNVLGKKRASPGPTDEKLSEMRAEIAEVVNGDEAATREAFTVAGLFPTTKEHRGKLEKGGGVPFDRRALPHTHGFNFSPISTPKPDLQYGYCREAFSTAEAGVMQHSHLVSYARPSTATWWPFFFVEFKSISRGGTHYVGENQNAGSGAHCIKSVETLLEYTRNSRLPTKLINSTAFSCVADVYHGSLWIHWQKCGPEGQPPQYVSTELDSFSWRKPEEVADFRNKVRNIIDYGIDKRLPMIKDALANLIPVLPEWNSEVKAAQVRSSDGDCGAGGSQGSRKRVK